MGALVCSFLAGIIGTIGVLAWVLYKKSFKVDLTPLVREKVVKTVVEAREKGPYGKAVIATPYKRSLKFRHCGTGRVVVEVWEKEEESLPFGRHNQRKKLDHFVCPICWDEFHFCDGDH